MVTGNSNRSFLFLGNFPVYNSGNGLTDGQAAADFTINGRILYEFDTISLRFDQFNGNPYLCQLAGGRPFAVEFNLGGLATLIALLKNRDKAPKGKFLPLAITAYNPNNTQYQTITYVSVVEDNNIVFYASNGNQQNQFAITGDVQIEMFIAYLDELKALANNVLAHKESKKIGGSSGGYNNYNAAPSTTAAPQTSSAPQTTAAPSTTAAPQTSSAPTIDMPTIEI